MHILESTYFVFFDFSVNMIFAGCVRSRGRNTVQQPGDTSGVIDMRSSVR